MKPSSFDSSIAFANDCSILDMWNRQDAILGELSTITQTLSTAKLEGTLDSDFFWHLHLRIDEVICTSEAIHKRLREEQGESYRQRGNNAPRREAQP